MDEEVRWQVGQQMSQDEGEEFIETVQWSDVLVATTHPWPGGYFSDPYQGNHLKRTREGLLFDWTPDIDDEFENDAPTFLGKCDSDEELLAVAVDFVLSGDHEVSAAVFFHYSDETFADWPGYFAAAIPGFYWFRCEYDHNEFSARLDSHLAMASPLYKRLSDFFESPDSAEYDEIKRAVLEGDGFGALYDRYKYPLP